MDVLRLAVFAILAASLALLVRAHRPEMAMQVALIAGIMILIFALGELTGVMDGIRAMAERYGIAAEYIGILAKIIGIAYLAQFAAQTCKDAGESALAAKVELGGRVMILAAALPAAVMLLELVSSLLPPGGP